MITFSHPWALALALPAGWLLWRSRRPAAATHAVANLFLWADASQEPPPAGDRRALPPWLTWLQAGVLLVLAVAIAEPVSTSSRPAVVLVIDVSLSMSAIDGGTTRLALAQRAAKAWLNRQPGGQLIRVISAGATPNIEGTVSAGSREADEAVDRLTVTTSAGDIGRAIEVARQETSGSIEVITDLAAPAGDLAEVTWERIGSPVANVGITRFAGLANGGAVLEIANFGDALRSVDIDVSGGDTKWHKAVDVAAESTRAFAFAPQRAPALTATISTGNAGDAIAGDNRRTLTLGPAKIRLALAAHDPAVIAAVNSLPDVAIGSAPPDVIVTADPLLANSTPALVFQSGGPVPVVTRTDTGARKITVAVDLVSTDWVLKPEFPIFVADSIDWLAGRKPESLSADDAAEILESDTRQAMAPVLPSLSVTAVPAPKNYGMVFVILAVAGFGIELLLRRRSAKTRLVTGAILAVAIVGVTLPFGGAARSAAIAVDESVSVSGATSRTQSRLHAETDAAGAEDRIETVKFGGAGTDIAAGLRGARATLPATGARRLLLVSDGQETTGDAVSEARSAGAAGVPIDVAPIDSRTPAYIASVNVPAATRAGAAVPVRVSISGSPRELVRLSVTRDGQQLDSRRVVLNDQGRATVELSDQPVRPGVTFYRATLTGDALDAIISESGGATTVTGRGKMLLISDQASWFQKLPALDVETIRPESAPDTRDALAPFSAIVIDGIPPHRLSVRQLDAIAAAVSLDETGLMFLGSRDSLDASEFPPGPFSELLPIDFTVLPNPPASGSALALLVDISGSMAATSDGVTKISAARDAIVRALSVVPKGDAVEVIGFASQPVTLVAAGEPRDAAALEGKLKSLSPSGSTAISPAVADAAQWLKRSPGRRKRLLLVTDGKTSVSDAEATRAAVRGQTIEVSVVTIGRDAEREWLTELAASTGGRAYFPERLTDLAREVAREAVRGAAGREVDERFSVRSGPHVLAPGDPAPVLNGYVAGRLRNGAAAAWKSQTDDAVLAAWRHGLGRVAVFASDLHGPWGSTLQSWPANSAFWRLAVEWIARPSGATPIEAQLILATGAPRLVVDLGERSGGGSDRDLPLVTASVTTPSGRAVTVTLHPVTSSRYESTLPLDEAGDYRAAINTVDAGTGAEVRVSRGWYWTGDRESESRGMNLPLLEEIARVSGGRMLPAVGAAVPAADTLFGRPRQHQPVDARPWLLFAALALLSFDYIRRAVEAL